MALDPDNWKRQTQEKVAAPMIEQQSFFEELFGTERDSSFSLYPHPDIDVNEPFGMP